MASTSTAMHQQQQQACRQHKQTRKHAEHHSHRSLEGTDTGHSRCTIAVLAYCHTLLIQSFVRMTAAYSAHTWGCRLYEGTAIDEALVGLHCTAAVACEGLALCTQHLHSTARHSTAQHSTSHHGTSQYTITTMQQRRGIMSCMNMHLTAR
jgi:hypothetical protein